MTRHKNLLNAETLLWIARTGTFRAAAQKLFTTQPAVSARMKELENSLGVALFEKRGRKLELTPAARRFMERVEPLLYAVDRAFSIDDSPDDVANATGTLRIGMGEISMTWFSGIVPELRRLMPRISYEIEMDLAFQLKNKLRQGDLDMAIVAGPVEDGRFISQPIGKTRMVWVASAALLHDEFGAKKSIDQILASSALWCVSRSSEYSVDAQRILRKFGANLDNINTCNHLVALIELVERGAGIGHLPEIMVADRIRSGKLKSLSGHLDDSELTFYLVCHPDRQHLAVERVISAVIESSLYELDPTLHSSI